MRGKGSWGVLTTYWDLQGKMDDKSNTFTENTGEPLRVKIGLPWLHHPQTHTHVLVGSVCVCVTNHAMTEATVSLPRTMFAFHGAQGVDTEVDFFLHKNAFLSLSLHLRFARSSSAGAAEACHTAANLWLTGFAFWERCGVTEALKCYSAFVKNSNSINSALERMSQETLLTSTLELVLTAIWSHHMQFGSASCQFACYLRSIT